METFDGHVQVNRYDAEGLRHELEEDGKLVQFIYRGDEIVAEKTDDNIIRLIRGYDLTASEADWARTYYHYASDEMGSITHMVTGQENEPVESGESSSGKVLNRYEYDAWGNLTVCEEAVENRFRFNGQQYDPITQQYYLRARYYNPVIARFTQEDTYRGDGLNLYAYCRNNPVSYVDPSGHWCDQKEQVYQGLLKKEGLTADTVDPDTQLRLMAEAANQVRGKIITLESTPELPGSVIGEQLLLPDLSEGGSKTTLALPAPKGTNPWLEGSEIVSMPAPKDCYINMAMSPGQSQPGGWGTFDDIPNVDYVRNNLAVIPEFKKEISHVQRYLVPEGTQIQVGIVGPQTSNNVLYPGGGNQVQILNSADKAKLIPIGNKVGIQ